MLDAQGEGYAAFNSGANADTNPYVMGQYAWKEWLHGFNVAKSESDMKNLIHAIKTVPHYGDL